MDTITLKHIGHITKNVTNIKEIEVSEEEIEKEMEFLSDRDWNDLGFKLSYQEGFMDCWNYLKSLL